MAHRLSVEGVSVRFMGIQALSDVTVSFNAKISGLIGPNGAGKSTLFSVISGYVRPVSGTVEVGGENMSGLRPYEIPRRGIVRSFQTSRLIEDESVFTNILFGMYASARSPVASQVVGLPGFRRLEREHRQAASKIADRFGFSSSDLLRPVKELAFGQRRRVEIARVLVSEPRVALLDEPAAGLTQKERKELSDVIRGYVAEHDALVLFTEHDVDLVRTLCEEIAVLDAGRLIATGAPGRVLEQEEVRRAYFGETHA